MRLRHTLAAPSWVMPGTVLENALFLETRVDEIGLLFFETEACLAYGDEDLPPELATLDVTWHVHLPADLPWAAGRDGGNEAARVALCLMDKVAFLGVSRAVLHPPAAGDTLALASFIGQWRAAGRAAGDILVENTGENDLCASLPLLRDEGAGLCVDLGHILAYGQDDFLKALPGGPRPRMVHLSAPGKKNGGNGAAHLPLTALDDTGENTALVVCASLADDGVVMAELFAWDHIEQSLPLIARWFATLLRHER